MAQKMPGPLARSYSPSRRPDAAVPASRCSARPSSAEQRPDAVVPLNYCRTMLSTGRGRGHGFAVLCAVARSVACGPWLTPAGSGWYEVSAPGPGLGH